MENFNIIKSWWILSMPRGNLRKLSAKPWAFGAKMKTILNIAKEILRVIDETLNLKWLFHNFT